MTDLYEVRVEERVVKELRRYRRDISLRLICAIESLSSNPRPRGARKLVDQPGWRIRVGDYRVLFEVDDASRVVTVYRAGHRSDVYR